jgi:hypothetical protein
MDGFLGVRVKVKLQQLVGNAYHHVHFKKHRKMSLFHPEIFTKGTELIYPTASAG